MKIKNLATILLTALVLTACGADNKLSFKNADTVIKSYHDITEDMTEIERQTFSRHMMLVLNDNNTDPSELKMSDWDSAVRQGRDLSYMTADDLFVKEYASELAIEGIDSLDGKSVAFVNKRGAELRAHILEASAEEVTNTIAELRLTIDQLEKDKTGHFSSHQAALSEEKALLAESAIYQGKAIFTEFDEKDFMGIRGRAKATLANPHSDAINRVRVDIHVQYKDYVARYGTFNMLPLGTPNLESGQSATNNLLLRLKPEDFINSMGRKLESDYELPADATEYTLTMHPILVRTFSQQQGQVEHKYDLSREQSNDIYNHERRLSTCDERIDVVKTLIVDYEERLQLIKNDQLDELKNIRGSHSKTCAPRGDSRTWW